MARAQERQKAITLRKHGKTYSDIRRILDIPKSTLSDWLSTYPLTNKQLKLIKKQGRKNKELAIERFRTTMRLKRDARLQKTYEDAKRNILPLSQRELQIAGMFLYWGEGQKRMNGPVSINNTDPKVMKFSLFWLTEILMIPKNRIRVYLHLYKDMNINNEMDYWSKELQIPLNQFAKPYIKESTREGLTHKGFGHGTCALVISIILLKEKLRMSIEAIASFYCAQI